MAELGHIAVQVPDLERAAWLYGSALELKRVASAESPTGNAIMRSDGMVTLTLLAFPEGTEGRINGPDWPGLHHFGFVVDEAAATARKIEQHGGRFSTQLPENYPRVGAETKFRDPLGIVFKVSKFDWTQGKAP